MPISPAYAQSAGGGDLFTGLLPLIIIFVVFYVLLIRPQQRKVKRHREMVEAVRRGDVVVTGGGIVGKVTKVGETDDITVEIAEGIRVQVVKGTLSDVRSKTEPVTGGAPAAARGAQPGGGLLGSLFGFGRRRDE